MVLSVQFSGNGTTLVSLSVIFANLRASFLRFPPYPPSAGRQRGGQAGLIFSV